MKVELDKWLLYRKYVLLLNFEEPKSRSFLVHTSKD